MLGKCCTQYASKFGKLSSGHRPGKSHFHSNPKERQCQRTFKLLHNCTHLTLAKLCSKFSKWGFNNLEPSEVPKWGFSRTKNSRYWSWNWKGRGTRDQIANICWMIEKAREFQKKTLEKEMTTHSSILAWKIPGIEEPGRLQSMGLQRVRHNWVTSLSRKTSTSALLTTPKPLCGSQQTGKFFKRWEYHTTFPVSWEICIQVKKQQLERAWNRLVPYWKKSTSRLYIVTLLI